MSKLKIIEKINGILFGFKKVHDNIEFFKADGEIIKDNDLTKNSKFSNLIDYVNENLKDMLNDDDYVIGKLISDDIKYVVSIEKDILNNFIVYKTNIDTDMLFEHFSIISYIYESDDAKKEDVDFIKNLSNTPMDNIKWTSSIKEYFDIENYENMINDDEFEGIVAVIDNESFIIENPKIKNLKMNKNKESFKPDDVDMVKERNRYKDLVLNIDTVELTNNPKENLRRYLNGIINAVKDSEFIDEDMLEDYRLNYDEFKKVGLDDVYASAKGTKAENVIFYFLNLLRDKKPEKKHIISVNDNKKINFLRKKFNFDKIFESKKISVLGSIYRENISIENRYKQFDYKKYIIDNILKKI